jgi:hypothetical protein
MTHHRHTMARQAGLLYLVVVATGIFSLLYVPSQLLEWRDAAATFSNIRASETLFRWGIVAGVICYTAFLLLPLALYRLLHPVHKPFAVAMVALAVVSVPFSLFNLLYKVNVLTLISDASSPGMDAAARQAAVMLQLRYYNNGIQLISIFWGLWLFPFGYLVFASGFLPKILGAMLMVGCVGYLVNTGGGFLYSGYADWGIARFVSLPASLGEIGICLWLLVMGARNGFATRTPPR